MISLTGGSSAFYNILAERLNNGNIQNITLIVLKLSKLVTGAGIFKDYGHLNAVVSLDFASENNELLVVSLGGAIKVV